LTRSLVVFGLSLSSSWGNGHAPTFRGLLRALARRGWDITFFERDAEWYRSNRDMPRPDFCDLRLYDNWPDADASLRRADAILVGSLIADGAALIDWLQRQERPLLFYDIDTPVTMVGLQHARATPYLRADQMRAFDVYFSFAGGPAIVELEQRWGARHAEALYCGVDPDVYRPVERDPEFSCLLSYMGTYTADRQASVEELLLATARRRTQDRFLLAGPQYPAMDLPPNVEHIQHVYPRDHANLYCSSTFTLNLTRMAMRQYGYAPSTRLFEAAASGACIISDTWPGLDELLDQGAEVLTAESAADVLKHFETVTPARRDAIGCAARKRILRDHTYDQRAAQVDGAVERLLQARWAAAT
jgi:spore maturation protein CgeB